MRTLIANTLIVGGLIAGTWCVAGCDDTAEEPAVEETTVDPAVEEGPAEDDVVAEAEPTEEELPIPEDFADEAEESISDENYAAQLDELEAEIEADIEAGGSTEGG